MPAHLFTLALFAACTRATTPPTPPTHDPVDLSQADTMLALLRARPPTPAHIDAVMAAPGTALIVKQQNLSRRVTAAQYRTTLSAITADTAPAIEPADIGERAKRGVAGLRDDVWPALHWGAANADILAERLAAIRTLDVGPAATRLAVDWLPEPTSPTVRLHVVMGGRAGAAAIERDIYFDVLAMSHRASVGASSYPSPAEIVEFFAHETHHVGFAAQVDRHRRTLRLGAADGRAYDLLVMLVSEGSATYLINAHRDLDRMRSDPQYRDHLADPSRLLATYERLLVDILEHGLDGDGYETALTPLVGSGFHSAGAVILDAIYRSAGRAGVLSVLRDPRQLLVEYAKTSGLHTFGPALVARTARLGD